jgi:hypothetical protein
MEAVYIPIWCKYAHVNLYGCSACTYEYYGMYKYYGYYTLLLLLFFSEKNPQKVWMEKVARCDRLAILHFQLWPEKLKHVHIFGCPGAMYEAAT